MRADLHKVGDDFIRPLPAHERSLPIVARLERLLSQRPRQQGFGLPPEVGRGLVDRIFAVDHQIIKDEPDLGVARGEAEIDDTAEAAALLLDMMRPWPLETLLDPARVSSSANMAARRSLAIGAFLNGIGKRPETP